MAAVALTPPALGTTNPHRTGYRQSGRAAARRIRRHLWQLAQGQMALGYTFVLRPYALHACSSTRTQVASTIYYFNHFPRQFVAGVRDEPPPHRLTSPPSYRRSINLVSQRRRSRHLATTLCNGAARSRGLLLGPVEGVHTVASQIALGLTDLPTL